MRRRIDELRGKLAALREERRRVRDTWTSLSGALRPRPSAATWVVVTAVSVCATLVAIALALAPGPARAGLGCCVKGLPCVPEATPPWVRDDGARRLDEPP